MRFAIPWVGSSLRAVSLRGAAALLALLLGTAPAWAQDAGAVSRGRNFLEPRLKFVLGFAHPTAEYQSCDTPQVTRVNDASGQEIPGAFALRIRVNWRSTLFNDQNSTTFTVFFDRQGDLTDLQGASTTFLRPFEGASLVLRA